MVDYVGTKNQLADILTKALREPIFQELRTKVGIIDISG